MRPLAFSTTITIIAYSGPDYGETGDPVYHAYYQWVPFFLCLQIMLFYAPYWIWKQLEGEHMKKILCGLENVVLDEKESKLVLSRLDSDKMT